MHIIIYILFVITYIHTIKDLSLSHYTLAVGRCLPYVMPVRSSATIYLGWL